MLPTAGNGRAPLNSASDRFLDKLGSVTSNQPSNTSGTTQQSAVVVGAGERKGIGGAVAAHAAREGMHVFVAGRTREKIERCAAAIEREGGAATPVVCDSTSADDIAALFATIATAGLPLRLAVYNTGRNVPAPFMQSTAELLRGHWRRCAVGGLMVGQAAIKAMLADPDDLSSHHGTVIFTGASASLRGRPLFAGFSAAKAGLRALAQSAAREFGPQGIHVAHVVIDGLVDGDVVQGLDAGIGKLLLRRKGEDGALQPDDVAKTFWMVHQQHRSAWTHELDLRPYAEGF